MAELVRLHPDDCAAIVEAVAQRVAQLLREAPVSLAAPEAAQLLTAKEVAEQFKLSREFVYEHQARLGVIKLGDGPRPRLRFDRARVARALDVHSTAPVQSEAPKATAARRRRSTTRTPPNGSPLLPYEGMEA
jgi:hypothetical protein